MRRRIEVCDPGLREQGSMAIEMVILAPILIMFTMVVVAFGRYVVVRGDVEAASRDAVRAASLERSGTTAAEVAGRTAAISLNGRWTCAPSRLEVGADPAHTQAGGQFGAGDIVSITLSCQVPWSDLGLIGLKGSKSVSATSDAPIDLYRRTGP
jgi:TadE-like protein